MPDRQEMANLMIALILDTDIGDDVDDAFALAYAARHPQIDLRAVTTVLGRHALAGGAGAAPPGRGGRAGDPGRGRTPW